MWVEIMSAQLIEKFTPDSFIFISFISISVSWNYFISTIYGNIHTCVDWHLNLTPPIKFLNTFEIS